MLLLFVSSAAWTLTNLRDELGDILAGDEDTLGDLTLMGLGLGDLTGALLWSVAVWYASPLQLLLVFLGRIDTERPSDWLMYNIGRAAQLPVDEVDYAAPAWVKGAAASACVCGGLSIAALLGFSLGDPTWSISSGIGALFAAAVFEAGRPKRLSVDEAKLLESQWQDFAAFADRQLQRSGRCHESEVFAAFRRAPGNGRYRSTDALPDSTLRDMVRNWHPGVERTRTGYLKNMSLQGSSSAAAAGPRGSRVGVAAAVVEAEPLAPPSSGSDLLDSIAAAADQEAVEQQQQQQRLH